MNALEYADECQDDLTDAVQAAIGGSDFVAQLSTLARFPAQITRVTFAIGFHMGLPAPVTAALTASLFPELWCRERGKLDFPMSHDKRQRLEEYERIVAHFDRVLIAPSHHAAKSDEFFARCRAELRCSVSAQ